MTLPQGERADAFCHAHDALAHKPFTIGLRPSDVEDWIEADDRLEADLALKDRILAEEGRAAFAALEGSEAAQAEALELLAAHLPRRYPTIYRRAGNSLRVLPGDRTVELAGEPPLLTASRLVQEDLLLMQRFNDGWRLVAGSLCFPSSWSLTEKLGRPMEAIHGPVPGFSGPMATRVERIFDHLRVEAPLERFNLSIYGDGQLRHGETREEGKQRFPPGAPILGHAHVRIERQTLRKLAPSGAILFTVRIHVDPLAVLDGHMRGPALALGLQQHVEALSLDELAYKGLSGVRDSLIATLKALCRCGDSEIADGPD